MSENPSHSRGKVPLDRFLNDFKSSLSDQELRDRYALTARGFVALIKTLHARKILTQADFEHRRKMAAQRDHEKESQFLSGLFMCPHCNHPHPQQFDVCPACGLEVYADVSPDAGDVITTTGSHFFVEDENQPDLPLEADIALDEQSADHFPPTELLAVEEESEAPQPSEISEPKKNKAGRLRSLLSYIRK